MPRFRRTPRTVTPEPIPAATGRHSSSQAPAEPPRALPWPPGRRGLVRRLEGRLARRYAPRLVPVVVAAVAVAAVLVGLAFVLGVAIGSALRGWEE